MLKNTGNNNRLWFYHGRLHKPGASAEFAHVSHLKTIHSGILESIAMGLLVRIFP